MSMRIALTGTRGWIGRGLCSELQKLGCTLEILHGDVRHPATFNTRFDTLIHLASAKREDFISEPGRAFEVNVQGTENALQACERNGAKMVFISTSGVYARDASGALSEETACIAPPLPYGDSKWQGEELCRATHARSGIPVRILRIFNVYGPGQNEQFLIGYLVRHALTNRPIQLQTPHARRDFIHVADVRHAVALAATHQGSGVETFNVGSGRSHSVLEVVEELKKALKHPVTLHMPANPVESPDQAIANISRIQRALGWTPHITLPQGIQSCIVGDNAC